MPISVEQACSPRSRGEVIGGRRNYSTVSLATIPSGFEINDIAKKIRSRPAITLHCARVDEADSHTCQYLRKVTILAERSRTAGQPVRVESVAARGLQFL